jgi:hypothetical protein
MRAGGHLLGDQVAMVSEDCVMEAKFEHEVELEEYESEVPGGPHPSLWCMDHGGQGTARAPS